MPEPVVAIVGTGLIGPVHLEALRRLGITVRGMLGSSPEKSPAAARTHRLTTGYASEESILRDPAITVAHLTSPNREIRYGGPVCIEVEDRAYEGSLASRQATLRESAGFLRQFITG